MKIEILEAIRRREALDKPLLQLSIILKMGGIKSEGYLEMCANRIASSELIDGEDVQIDFESFPDLLLSSDGVISCREILENYVPDDIIADAIEVLCKHESLIYAVNNYAEMLRDMTIFDLWKTFRELGTGKYGDEDMRTRKYILAEVWNRSVFARVKRWLWAVLIRICTKVKYHRLISVCDKVCVK